MFGKKKESGTPVMHYEGIEGFATDYPCRIEVKGDVFEIRRIKPETTVTLPRKVHVEVSRSGKKHIQDEGCQKVLLGCGL